MSILAIMGVITDKLLCCLECVYYCLHMGLCFELCWVVSEMAVIVYQRKMLVAIISPLTSFVVCT